MKKLIIKTTIITLSAIILLFGIVFGTLCLVKPKAIANVFDDLGYYSASMKFYERQYNKTKDIGDLIVLVDKSYNSSNADKEKYLGTLIEHDQFVEYCQQKNTNLEQGQMLTEEYYAGYFAVVLIQNNKFDLALSVSKSFVDTYGYTKFNPIRTMVNDCLDLLNSEQKALLKNNLLVSSVEITDAVQIAYILEDLTKFN